MIEDLRENIKIAQQTARELVRYEKMYEDSQDDERRLIGNAIVSLKERIKILNSSIPAIIEQIGVVKMLPVQSKASGEKLAVILGKDYGKRIVLRSGDKERFIEELNISRDILNKIRKNKKEYESETKKENTGAGFYSRTSNRFFSSWANKLLREGYFESMREDFKKADIGILFQTYVSVMLFSIFLSLIVSIFVLIFIALNSQDILISLIKYSWVILALPIITFFALYYYPSSERKSMESEIDQEIPFAAIYMGAIAGSGIEPSEIFRIAGISREYPSLRKEMLRVLNYVNVYGYDLVSALQKASKNTSSVKLSEFFSGLATTIYSGGELKTFFEKRAETLLMNYRLERERFSGVMETFMDIYISVVIATPMILMLLLIIMSVAGISVGLSPGALAFVVVAGVAIVNIIFLGVLHIKQPSY